MMMKTNPLSRRDFLKIGGLSLSGLALSKVSLAPNADLPPSALGIVRVTVSEISVYQEPDYESEEIGVCHHNQLIHYYEKLKSLTGLRTTRAGTASLRGMYTVPACSQWNLAPTRSATQSLPPGS